MFKTKTAKTNMDKRNPTLKERVCSNKVKNEKLCKLNKLGLRS